MDRRATSLKPIVCADKRGVLAMTMQCSTRSGQVMAQLSACMPPSDPPMTAANLSLLKWSANRAWARTQSSTVSKGHAAPQGLPVSGMMGAGPSEPQHEPILFTPTTKQLSAFIALPGTALFDPPPHFLGNLGDEQGGQ